MPISRGVNASLHGRSRLSPCRGVDPSAISGDFRRFRVGIPLFAPSGSLPWNFHGRKSWTRPSRFIQNTKRKRSSRCEFHCFFNIELTRVSYSAYSGTVISDHPVSHQGRTGITYRALRAALRHRFHSRNMTVSGGAKSRNGAANGECAISASLTQNGSEMAANLNNADLPFT